MFDLSETMNIALSVTLTDRLNKEWRRAKYLDEDLDDEDIYKIIGIPRAALTLSRYEEAIRKLEDYNNREEMYLQMWWEANIAIKENDKDWLIF